MKRFVIPIKGMHCRSCELLLEESIGKVQGVKSVKVSYKAGTAIVGYGADVPSRQEVAQAVRDSGYDLGRGEAAPWLSGEWSVYRELIVAAVTLAVLYSAARGLGILGLHVDTTNVSLPMVLVVGLVAGMSTCMAMVGGLVLGLSASHAEQHPEATPLQNFRPHLFFNLGRIGGYAFVGTLLGALGSILSLSAGLLAVLTIFVGTVMIFLGLKLTGVSPRLKEGGFTLPAGLARLFGLNRHKREYSHLSAGVTGALTIFLPCGFTQAMQLYAVSTGSAVRGALVMGLFALGTAPALLGIGGLTAIIKGAAARRFYAIVGLAVLLFGIFDVGNGLALAGFSPSLVASSKSGSGAEIVDGYQIVRMTQHADGYEPSSFTVQKGVPVRWVITSETDLSCAASISMPAFKIFRQLKQGENTIEFTPEATGSVPFTCSMGMYRGVFNVIDGGASSATATSVTTPVGGAEGYGYASVSSGGSCGIGGGCGCGGGVPAAAPAPGRVEDSGGIQRIASRDDYALSPNEFTVQVGRAVEWTVTPDAPPAGCMTGFYNGSLGIRVAENYPAPTVMTFTPTAAGDYDVTCPMGMWRATIHVK